MAYKKCEFKDGETVITAECMNAMQDAICQLETDRENHNKANNPHKLDAESVGARPNTWTPSAEEVGAAPSGYGLGGQATFIDNKNLVDITETGFYSWGDTTTASDKPASAGDLLVIKRSATIIDQIAFSHDTVDHTILVRKVLSGVGTEWEYLNPPMAIGEEYRTTERYKGKTVYTMVFSFGTLPNASSASAEIPYPARGGNMIFAECITNTGAVLNVIDSVSNNAVWVKTVGDYSPYTADIHVKYTKD